MAKTSNEIIRQFGDKLTEDIKKAIPRATGKTADSVNIEFTKTGFVIRGGAQIGAIIDGRKPSQKGTKPGQLKPMVLEWIKAKRIRPRESSMTEETLAFLIARSIHRNGTKGQGNIFAKVLTASRINSLTQTLINSETIAIQSQIIKEFKF